jgi:hypothetical protein
MIGQFLNGSCIACNFLVNALTSGVKTVHFVQARSDSHGKDRISWLKWNLQIGRSRRLVITSF